MKRFKNILFVFDSSLKQDNAFSKTLDLAKNNQARLTVVDVVPNFSAGIGMPTGGPISEELMDWVKADSHKQMDDFLQTYDLEGIDVQVVMLVGEVRFIEIVREVLRHNFDLVIKAAENPDWIDRLFGSDDLQLLRKCPCPVWLMRSDKSSDFKAVLAAVDFDQEEDRWSEDSLNGQILSLASSLAVSYGASLHVVHAWEAPEVAFASIWAENPDKMETEILEHTRKYHERMMSRLMDEFFEDVGEEAYDFVSPEIHTEHGRANEVIPATVKTVKADLVVMGTIARTGIPGMFIGNTAESIIDQLNCSLMAVKPKGFETPVALED